MGALHVVHVELEVAASRGGRACAGELEAVDPASRAVDLRVRETFSRSLPPRSGPLRRAWDRLRPAPVPAPSVRTFAIPPPPVATDAWSHPVFERLAGGLGLHEVAPGDRLFVIEAVVVGLLRDDPPTRARVVAAFDRTADLAWAAEAPVDALHLALLDPRRWDAALDELRWRHALDARGLAARVPPDRLAGLYAVVGAFDEPDQRAFVEGAARELARTGDRVVLADLVRASFDFVRFDRLEPLLLMLDAGRPGDAPALAFARIRLAMILREEPARAASFARLAAHLGPPR